MRNTEVAVLMARYGPNVFLIFTTNSCAFIAYLLVFYLLQLDKQKTRTKQRVNTTPELPQLIDFKIGDL